MSKKNKVSVLVEHRFDSIEDATWFAEQIADDEHRTLLVEDLKDLKDLNA